MSVCPFGRHFTFKPLVVTDFEKENVSEAVGSPGEEAQPGASRQALRILGLGRCSPLLHRAGKPFEHDLPGKAMALSCFLCPLLPFSGLECFKCQSSWFDGEFYTNAEYYLVNLTRIDCDFTR